MRRRRRRKATITHAPGYAGHVKISSLLVLQIQKTNRNCLLSLLLCGKPRLIHLSVFGYQAYLIFMRES